MVSFEWLKQQGRKDRGGLPVQGSKSSWPAASPAICRRVCTQLKSWGLGVEPLHLLQASPDLSQADHTFVNESALGKLGDHPPLGCK